MTEEDFKQIAMEIKDGAPLVLQMRPFDAYMAVVILQMAWRHPDLSKHQSGLIETFGRNLQARIGAVSEKAAESLEAGWDPRQDIPRGGLA